MLRIEKRDNEKGETREGNYTLYLKYSDGLKIN